MPQSPDLTAINVFRAKLGEAIILNSLKIKVIPKDTYINIIVVSSDGIVNEESMTTIVEKIAKGIRFDKSIKQIIVYARRKESLEWDWVQTIPLEIYTATKDFQITNWKGGNNESNDLNKVVDQVVARILLIVGLLVITLMVLSNVIQLINPPETNAQRIARESAESFKLMKDRLCASDPSNCDSSR